MSDIGSAYPATCLATRQSAQLGLQPAVRGQAGVGSAGWVTVLSPELAWPGAAVLMRQP